MLRSWPSSSRENWVRDEVASAKKDAKVPSSAECLCRAEDNACKNSETSGTAGHESTASTGSRRLRKEAPTLCTCLLTSVNPARSAVSDPQCAWSVDGALLVNVMAAEVLPEPFSEGPLSHARDT